MGSGTDEFKRKIGGYLATLLFFVAMFFCVTKAYNYYTTQKQTEAEIAMDNITIRDMSKNVKKVERSVVKSSKKTNYVQYLTTIGPRQVEITDKDGRTHVGMTIKEEQHSFVVKEPKPVIHVSDKSVGYYRTPHIEGIGLTAGIIVIPLVTDLQVQTGVLLGRNVEDKQVQAGFLMLLTKPLNDSLSIAIGDCYNVAYGHEATIGVRYGF